MLSSSPAVSTPSVHVFERIVRKRGRECNRCGGRHRDPRFKWCGPCRDIAAAWHQAYRLDHLARKLCTECVQKKNKQSLRRCAYHLEYDRKYQMKIREDQAAKGLCKYGRCKTATEGYFCDEHREKTAAATAARAVTQARRGWAA
jgi:hypothetical protein